MSISIARICVIIVVMAAFGGPVALAGQIDNPSYGYWAKFKPGSTQKTTTDSVAVGQKTTIEIVTTLLEVTPDKITVETKTDATAGDTKLKQRVRKQDVPAKIDQRADASEIKHSTETITAAGKTYACQVSEETREGLVMKTWTSEEVPGGVVKAEMRSEGLSITTLLVDSTTKR
jgi:hypothetical protein